MPNSIQLIFLLSFTLIFTALVLLSHYLQARLLAAGYRISDLILIGLPNHDTPPPVMSHSSLLGALDALKSVDIPYLGTYDLVQVATSPAFLATTGVLFGALFYFKVLNSARPQPLNPKEWVEYPLQKKIQISPNTAVYRFKLHYPQDVLGLPIGQHISVSAEIGGKVITRSYTPISSDDDHGFFELLIKTYEKGNISRHIAQLKVGDNIRIKGPKGNFKYRPGLTTHLSMIAGGTGITPMIQVMRAALKNSQDTTTISLIYANVNQEDILLKDDLDQLLNVHGKRLKIFYVLNNPPPNWKGGVGFVTKEHILEHLPNPASTDSKLLICGPPPMVGAMKKNLDELKYPAPNTISKLDDKIFVF